MEILIKEIDGKSVPFILCELCGEELGRNVPAEYLIPDLADDEDGVAIVGHTKCTMEYEKRMGKCFGNMSLGYLLACLITNHAIDIDQEQKNVKALKEIFG